jgi:phage-related minor tail protein
VLAFGTLNALTQARLNEREDTKMKTSMSRQGAYIGAGAGLVLFAIFGLLPGSLLGGAAGINIAGMLFGLPLESGLLSRAIVLASMLVGVLVSGTAIVMASTAVGWLAGAAVGTTVQENTLAATERR